MEGGVKSNFAFLESELRLAGVLGGIEAFEVLGFLDGRDVAALRFGDASVAVAGMIIPRRSSNAALADSRTLVEGSDCI